MRDSYVLFADRGLLKSKRSKRQKPAAEKLSVFLSGKKNLFPERKAEREKHERGERALCGAA